MDKGNKVKTTDMTALQSDLVTIATGMKRNTVLEEADHVEKATYTGKILATDIQNIRAAINGLEAESSGNCCESCQGCQRCQSHSQCTNTICSQCSIYQCTGGNCDCGNGCSDDGGP